ncbi:hypothetical protein I302_104511 [Kwoniella bestiolae CBS 10118]|uniref:Uncharacterized protein n=1 Tax=Kwoniella bestiolae CBS 10118 TaxID=1296100 RepID=A0A1B9GBG3_9TREE|nr:hypothetical protein I302_03217 [Kwoniella bestiolae CBS 10118]OCF28358.1 hypothetical protein I302_03217 [Kwoniella bestiolae CBS 10118]
MYITKSLFAILISLPLSLSSPLLKPEHGNIENRQPMYYTHNTTDTSISLIMRDAVSPNVTLNFGIAEANRDVLVEQRWSLSGPIPFVQAK